MARKPKDHTGRQYGQLTLMDYRRSGGGGVGAIWTATCTCGKVVEVIAKDVAAGKRSSCGMCTVPLGIANGRIRTSGVPKGHRKAFRALIRKSNDPIQVNVDDYLKCVRNRCVVCESRDTHAEWVDARAESTPTNLCAICDQCSIQRRGQNLVKWLEWLVRVVNRRVQRMQDSQQ